MVDVWLSIGVVCGLAVGTVLTGRALASVLRIRLLRRWSPENVLASAFVGTAVWVLTFGCCSYLGLPAVPAAAVVIGLAATLWAMAVAAGARLSFPTSRRWLAPAVVLIPVALAVFAVLLPVVFGDGFPLYTDSLLYDNVAEWLQSHGFREVSSYDPQHPMWQSVCTLQSSCHRMGPIFLLALVRALCPGFLPVQLFPAVTAWGVALDVAAVYVLCRWAFRCGKGCSLFAALLAAGVNPLTYSADYGFLCQVYGTAALPFALAVLARLAAPVRWRLGEAALFALAACLQLSVYSELSPVLAAASLLFLAAAGARAWRTARFRRFLAFTAATALLFVASANVEIVRAVRSLLVMTRLNGVGWHLDWSAAEYWAFAMGARPYPLYLKPWMVGAAAVAAAACTALFLAGLGSAVRRRPSWPLLAALLVLGGLAVYFHWLARDPWTGAVGHTWNQFKLCKWSFTLVVTVQGAGLHAVLRRVPRLRPAVLAAASLAAVLAAGSLHCKQAFGCARDCRALVRSDTPLTSIHELRWAVRELGPSSLYFISPPDADPRYTALITSVLYSHPFVNGWSDRRHPYFHPNFTADRNPWPPPDDMLGVMVGEPPFEAPLRRLPCGVSAVDLRRAFVVRIDNPGGCGSPHDLPAAWVGPGATTIELWSPQAGDGTLLLAAPRSPAPGRGAVRLVVAPEGAPEREIPLGGAQTAVPLSLRPGLNRVSLRRAGAPPLPGSGPSEQILCIEKVDIILGGAGP